MTPEVRAIADQFIFEQATLKHFAAMTPEGALARPVAGHESNLGQWLGHLAATLDRYAAMVEDWNCGGSGPAEGWHEDAEVAATAPAFATTTVSDLHAAFGAGLVRLFNALAAIPDEAASRAFGGDPLEKALRTFVAHAGSHAIELLDAAPELRMDPLILNWVLSLEFESDSARSWRADLLEEARNYVDESGEGDEE